MKKEITISEQHLLTEIVGPEDKYIKLISRSFDIKIFTKGNKIVLEGEQVEIEQIQDIINSIIDAVKKGYRITSYDLMYGINQIKKGKRVNYSEIFENVIKVSLKGKIVFPRTYGQVPVSYTHLTLPTTA